ncbi:hypothetical protein KW521_12655 [Vibrio fluvialis]|nr:hypothetical protein [Vibrio fluvialis]
MASFSAYPQNVTFQTVNVSSGGGSENLLINPRGKINQANENDGVLSPGQYFCDGWKAGAAGAEVYIDPDGFRLISGSIVQLVPNNLEAGRTIRGNMDVVIGLPAISINGGTDNELSDTAEYIQFEVSGDNSKFTRLILAESNSLPIYQQSSNELEPCKLFYEKGTIAGAITQTVGLGIGSIHFSVVKHKVPAITVAKSFHYTASADLLVNANRTYKEGFEVTGSQQVCGQWYADCRP